METIIREKLAAAFDPVILDIRDESAKHAGHAGVRHARTSGKGTHFRIKIVSAAFTSLPRLQRHRLVHDCLKAELKTQIHALSLILLSPEEDSPQ